MPSEIPSEPTSPFDGSSLTDDQVQALTQQQLLWVDLTDKQWIALTDYQLANPQPVGPPHEHNPDYIPAPEHLEEIRGFFRWIDTMHEGVRTPSGMAWIEVQLLLASLGKWMQWARSEPPINPHYRYRIDAPMNPDATVSDYLPEEWGNK